MTAYNHTRKHIYYFWTTEKVDKTLYPFTQQQNFMPYQIKKKKVEDDIQSACEFKK